MKISTSKHQCYEVATGALEKSLALRRTRAEVHPLNVISIVTSHGSKSVWCGRLKRKWPMIARLQSCSTVSGVSVYGFVVVGEGVQKSSQTRSMTKIICRQVIDATENVFWTCVKRRKIKTSQSGCSVLDHKRFVAHHFEKGQAKTSRAGTEKLVLRPPNHDRRNRQVSQRSTTGVRCWASTYTVD